MVFPRSAYGHHNDALNCGVNFRLLDPARIQTITEGISPGDFFGVNDAKAEPVFSPPDAKAVETPDAGIVRAGTPER